ncbi:MAG: MarC family protein [Vicinamibacteria bacterium]
MTIFSAAVLLFLVLDPFGNIPFFLAALQGVPSSRHRRIIVRELVIALGVLVLFLFAGQHILGALDISEPALRAAGGTVLFLIAIRMVFPWQGPPAGEEIAGEPFIVPLAIPYVAGPSALAAVLLIMNQEPERWPEWLIALVSAWLACGIIILASNAMARHLEKRVLVAIERLMGMLLVALAIQMLMSGIRQFMDSGS